MSVQDRAQSHDKNLKRLELAATRTDIVHLEVPVAACGAKAVQSAMQQLVEQNDREWISFTLVGSHSTLDDLYAPPVDGGQLYTLLVALKKFKVLNLQGCLLGRGHGLECMLKALPLYDQLQELRIEGWQIDRVSATALVEALQWQIPKSITKISLRSCRFVGEGTFHQIIEGLKSHGPQLETLNLSYCGLVDHDVIPLVDIIKGHSSIRQLHVGGNECRTQDSVTTLSEWIQEPTCQLENLNLRALWVGFTDEGLLQRFINIAPLFDALAVNRSLKDLTLSENYLEDEDLLMLKRALLTRPSKMLRHLDVRENPFGEMGAKGLEHLVRSHRNIASIRFENDIMPPYRCGELVKLLADFNRFDRLLVHRPVDLSMSMWPHAFERMQRHPTESNDAGKNLMFRFLRSPTGPYGHELSLRIATHK